MLLIRIHAILMAGMVVAGCAATPAVDGSRSIEPQRIVGQTWQWVSTITPAEKIEVPEPARYAIRLMPEGKLQARFDCNRGFGSFVISPGKLSFGPLLSTRKACPADTLDGPFMRDLQRVASFFIENGALFLELPHDSGTMRFRLEK